MANPTPPCKSCGNLFRKPHLRAVYCSRRCAIAGRSERQENGCLIWTGAKNDMGYGQISFNGSREYVHRIAYEDAKGPLGGLRVCHTCDTPACIEPSHMFAGTQADNMVDMAKKERSGTAKLTIKDVRVIRKLHGSLPVKDIAKAYGVCVGTIECVIYNKWWKHVE